MQQKKKTCMLSVKIGGLYKGSNINLEDAVSNKTHVLLTGPRNRRNISAIWQNSINQKSYAHENYKQNL